MKHRLFTAVVLSTGCTVIASWLLGLHWNASASMPTGLYRTTALAAPPVRGDTVLFCLAGDAAVVGLQRGYLEPGTCPGGSAPLVKPIAAVPWDYVVIDQNGVVVNGQPIPNSAPLADDPSGRVLRAVPPGSYVVMQDSVWVVSGHDPRSYDSRYWGPLPVNAITGRAVPVLTGDIADHHARRGGFMPDNHSSQSQNLMPNRLTGDALDRDKMQAIGAAE